MRDLDAEDRQDVAWETQGTEGGPPPDVRYGNAASENDLTAWARGRALHLERANPNVLADCIEIAVRANEGNEWASILTQILAED